MKLKLLKNAIKNRVRHIPFVYDYLQKRKTDSSHRELINLLKGQTAQNVSNRKSVLHFSINKAATQHVKGVLKRMASENALIPVDYNGYAFATNLPYLDLLSSEEMEKYKHIFRRNGYLYSVLGGMVKNIDYMEDYHIILTVRDPRDILVSNYFSLGYSHAIPQKTGNKREAFLRRRKNTKKMTIDEFVLKHYPRVLLRFKDYQEDLLNRYEHVTLLRYEDMTSNYKKWLTDLSNGCGFQISSSLMNELVTEFEDRKVQYEDKFSHVRKGKPGDYREKLKSETIKTLNDMFYPYSSFYGYEIGNDN